MLKQKQLGISQAIITSVAIGMTMTSYAPDACSQTDGSSLLQESTRKEEHACNSFKAVLPISSEEYLKFEPAPGCSREMIEQRNSAASESRQTNVAGMVFSQSELAEEISKCLKEPFAALYKTKNTIDQGSKTFAVDIIESCDSWETEENSDSPETDVGSFCVEFEGTMGCKVCIRFITTRETCEKLGKATYGDFFDELRRSLGKVLDSNLNDVRVSFRQGAMPLNRGTFYFSIRSLDDEKCFYSIYVLDLEPGSPIENLFRDCIISNDQQEGEIGVDEFQKVLACVIQLLKTQVMAAIHVPQLDTPIPGYRIEPGVGVRKNQTPSSSGDQ